MLDLFIYLLVAIVGALFPVGESTVAGIAFDKAKSLFRSSLSPLRPTADSDTSATHGKAGELLLEAAGHLARGGSRNLAIEVFEAAINALRDSDSNPTPPTDAAILVIRKEGAAA